MENSQKAFGKWLDLIVAIAGDRELTADDMAKILGTTTRNVYHVMKALRDYGFVINHSHRHYSLDAMSPFFQEISRCVNLTTAQAQFLYDLLSKTDMTGTMSGLLRRKLQRFYHLSENVDDTRFMPASNKKFALLQRAMRQRRVVVLHDYASSNSRTVSDRTVEPFLFLGDNSDVRAFEIKSGKNKSFKISRIGRVEVLDTDWFNEEKHKKVFTDMFLFSGEEHHTVRLRLDIVAHNLILEEYPHSVPMMKPDGDGHWIFETFVVSYAAISRFILGLYEDIEVLADDGLKRYLDERIKRMAGAISQNGTTAPSDQQTNSSTSHGKAVTTSPTKGRLRARR